MQIKTIIKYTVPHLLEWLVHEEKTGCRVTKSFFVMYTGYCGAIIGHKWRTSENQK